MQPSGGTPGNGDTGDSRGSGAEHTNGDGSEDRSWVRQLTAFGHVGMMFPVAIAVGFLGGRWLDARLGTDPWLSLAGFGLGVAAALRNLIQSVSRLGEDERQDREAEIERRRRERRGPDRRS